MTAPTSVWGLEGGEAKLQSGPLGATILLDQPSRGLKDLTWNRRKSVFAPLQLMCGTDHPACRRIEAYIRGEDLVANYEESDSPLGTPQIYWRVRHDPLASAVGIEVILSKQTSLLDSQPKSSVHSCGGELWYATVLESNAFSRFSAGQPTVHIDRESSTNQLFLFRDEHLQLSYLQMVHPSDFDSVVLTDQGGPSGWWHLMSLLFPDRLEKGVIRRARICGWFLPAEDDLAVAVELARRFIDEPLPLTV
jgi:hypothetical protein